MPLATANDAVKQRQLPCGIRENLVEVLNVGAQWFNGMHTPRLALQVALCGPGELADDVAAALMAPAARLDVEVDIPCYGKGIVSLLVTKLT
jgi:hypothetical protein